MNRDSWDISISTPQKARRCGCRGKREMRGEGRQGRGTRCAGRADHMHLFPTLSSECSATSPWEPEVGHSGNVYTTEIARGCPPATPPPGRADLPAHPAHDSSFWGGSEPTPSLATVLIQGAVISQPHTFLQPGQNRGELDKERDQHSLIRSAPGSCLVLAATACLSTYGPTDGLQP